MKSIKTIVLLLLIVFSVQVFAVTPVADPDAHRFDKEIERFIDWDKQNAWPENNILFTGSSSTRMWMTHDAFPNLPVINRGFGGAHISDVVFFIDETVLKYNPDVVFIYCGDNDIAGKKSPQQVFGDYQEFVEIVHKALPETKIVYVPIKPSIARWSMWPDMEKTNTMISDWSAKIDYLEYIDIATPMLEKSAPPPADLFLDDGLHMTPKGYAIWNQAVLDLLKEIM